MNGTVSAIFISFLLIVGAIFYSGGKTNEIINPSIDNVSIVNGRQIIDLRAKGGYQPRITIATAGIPTTLRVNTNGTFDCSAIIRIPSLDIGKVLPQTGDTDIDLGSPKSGILNGTCGMGMYPFEIDFKL